MAVINARIRGVEQRCGPEGLSEGGRGILPHVSYMGVWRLITPNYYGSFCAATIYFNLV